MSEMPLAVAGEARLGWRYRRLQCSGDHAVAAVKGPSRSVPCRAAPCRAMLCRVVPCKHRSALRLSIEACVEGATASCRPYHIGHSYIGHSYIGHSYIGHSYIGHNYIGRSYRVVQCNLVRSISGTLYFTRSD